MIQFIKNGSNGIDTSDATATEDDILLPKTAYVNNEKIIGAIQTVLQPMNNDIELDTFTSNYTLYDYRKDIGYALAWNGSSVVILKIENDNSFRQVANIDSGWEGTPNDYKFGLNPIYVDDSSIIYNIFISANKFVNRGSWKHSVLAVRFDVMQEIINNEYSNVLWSEVSYVDSYLAGKTFKNYLIPISGDKVLLLQKEAGNNGVGSTVNMTPCLVFITGNSGTKLTSLPLVDNAKDNKGFGYASQNANLYICYTNNKYAIYGLNDAKTSATQLVTSTISAYNPVLLDDKYIYNNKLYNSIGQELKSYNNIFDSGTWKYYINSFIIEVLNDGNAKIYSFDSSTFDIAFEELVPNLAINGITSASYGNRALTAFPKIERDSLAIFSSSYSRYNLFISIPATEEVVQIIRDGKIFSTSRGLTLIDSSKLLVGEIANGLNGQVIGSMPNNGTLEFSPTTTSQTVPSGYTSGGTISAVTSSIDSNIIAENIKAGVTILGVTGTYSGENSNE